MLKKNFQSKNNNYTQLIKLMVTAMCNVDYLLKYKYFTMNMCFNGVPNSLLD